jgi:hypothetical protein
MSGNRGPCGTYGANSVNKQVQNRWKKGQSGNPSGRPKGARHRTTVAIEALLGGEGEALTRKAIELAKCYAVCHLAAPKFDRIKHIRGLGLLTLLVIVNNSGRRVK